MQDKDRLGMVWLLAIALLGALATGWSGLAQAQTRPLFSLVGDYPLGVKLDRTDYESIDPAARRLYIAMMGAGRLDVFDIDGARLVADLDGFDKVTGVLSVPELHKVYASVPGGGLARSLSVGFGMIGLSSGYGEVAVRDTRSLREIARLPGGVFPDGIAFDAQERRVFVSDELGSALIVIDSDSDKPAGRIDMPGEVGNVRYDAVTGRIFVPDQSHNALVAVDPAKLSVISRHALAGCEHPHGLIVAPAGGVGYVACDGNDRLLTVDLASGRVLRNQPVAHDPDVLAVDAGAHRLYAASESGNLSVFDIAAQTAPVVVGNVFIADEAHTLAVDPVSHRLYFALADVNGRSILRVLAPRLE